MCPSANMYNKKRVGLRKEPYGRPEDRDGVVENKPVSTTEKVRFTRDNENHLSAEP